MPDTTSVYSELSADPGSGAAGRRSKRPWIFAATIAVILIAAIEGTIVSTAMPTIVGALGGFDYFTWTFGAYFLTQAVTIPIYGGLADIYGRKRVLLVGIGLFLIGSILCGLAWNMASLVAFRVVQGLGAGALVTLAQTIIGDLYEPVERAGIQGYISGAWAAGAVLGPLLGSFLVTHVNWAWVFWVNVPVGCIAACMIMATLHEDRQPHHRRIDYVGSALMAMGASVLMFLVVQAATLSTTTILLLLAVSVALLTIFVVHEGRTPEPILPLTLLRNRIIAGGNLTCVAAGAVLMGSTAFLSLYVQGVMGLSALIAGFAVGGPSLSWPFGSFVGGQLIRRTSYRATAIVGAVPLLFGASVLLNLTPASRPWFAAAGPLLIGLGMGFIVPTFLVAVQSAVGWSQRGIATSTVVFSRIVGQAVGTAAFGGILNGAISSRSHDGSEAINQIMNPAVRRSLSPADLEPLVQMVSAGLHHVYLVVGLLALGILVMTFSLPAGLRAR